MEPTSSPTALIWAVAPRHSMCTVAPSMLSRANGRQRFRAVFRSLESRVRVLVRESSGGMTCSTFG